MRKINDTAMEGDILGINPDQVLIGLLNEAVSPFPEWLVSDWIMKKPAQQIADETGETLKDIYRMLRELNKAIIEVVGISCDEE